MGLEIYNPKNKLKFIDSKENDGYKELIRWVFTKTANIESDLGRDLLKFDLDDYKVFFKERSINKQTANLYLSVFRQYVDWAMKNVPTAPSQNILEEIPDDFIQEIARKPRTKYLHSQEIGEIAKLTNTNHYNYPPLHNAQDRALVFLLFSGVMGSAMEDLINIKEEHIDFEANQIYIPSNDRSVTILPVGMQLIKNALNESTYRRYISSDDKAHGGVENKLTNSDYLFRKAVVGNGSVDTDGKMTRPAFQKRLVTLKSWLGIDNFTANTIFHSGLINRCKLYIDKYDKLTKETLDPAFDAYGISDGMVRYQKINFIKQHLPDVYGKHYDQYVKKYNSDR
ncbi:hypothetical protein [Halobacillus litoralis]|uniref:phage lytic cycle repressor MrpR family protein n=1 Tax=Halobacillus litoralis TaxID=45668 RepID=UPI001CD1B8F5|nr:hypothetical protein [Halobacillus litoralis]MCA1021589.1 hypothetical protein [Halobacillus litoralis]